MTIRQPIVSVLGHVDHGKTTFLDVIRGGSVVAREAGKITQHIGATEVPIETIYEICNKQLDPSSIKVPGLLFIDTPGHHSFTTLRSRGGALADLAVLVIDINEGIMPQTLESINILKQCKTPFIIAGNKVDRINGWIVHENTPFMASFNKQEPEVQEAVDGKLYKLIGQFTDEGYPIDRYDRVVDFTESLAIIPTSTKYNVGVSDVLLVLVGLAQRFLEKNLEVEDEPGQGTVLEVKEEKGLGTTLDSIIYKGTVSIDDTLVIGTTDQPVVTKVKALLKPKELDEIRDPRQAFDKVDEVTAAAGVKILAQNLDGVLSGAIIRVVADGDVDTICQEVADENCVAFECLEDGLVIKADAVGSLEAIVSELGKEDIPIRVAEVGDVSLRDVKEVATTCDPLRKAILAFNVKMLPEVEAAAQEADVMIFSSPVIYKILEDYAKWFKETKAELDAERRGDFSHPGMFKVLPDCIFRISKPAVVGVRVLAGRIRVGQGVLREDGNVIGSIKSIQKDKASVKEAKQGDEVAVSIDKITIGRQLKGDDVVYVDIPEHAVKKLKGLDLTEDEKDVMDKVCQIKRKCSHIGWGM